MTQMAPSILKSLYEALPPTLQERRAAQCEFEERLQQRWQDGLDRLEMLIIMAHEAGEIYVEDLQREFVGQAAPEEAVLMDVLVALHCRACRTAREVFCLLRAGYPRNLFPGYRRDRVPTLAETEAVLAKRRRRSG
jgi:hypothetical protein